MALKKRTITILSSLAVFAAALGVAGGVTYAAFSSEKAIEQGIAPGGAHGTLLFLAPGVWTADDPDYLIYSWDKDNGSTAAEWVTPTGRSTNGYVIFEIDLLTRPDFLFARMNPSRAGGTNSFDIGYCWNKTVDLTYDSANKKRLFTILEWGSPWNDQSGEGEKKGSIATPVVTTYTQS